jgi:peptidoglycan/LPS O-acetylase OafA/YrhL
MQVSQMKYVKEFDGLRGLMAVWVLLGYWASTIETSFKLFKSAPVQTRKL